MGSLLPHVNVALNAACAASLILGRLAIRRGDVERHRRRMIAAFACSVLFLISYLTRVALTGDHRYPGEGWDRGVYLVVLASHVVLAAIVPWMAIRTLYLGLQMRRDLHRRWARWTWPIWLYVSITGIVVYLMLYHLGPALHGAVPDAAGARDTRGTSGEGSTATGAA